VTQTVCVCVCVCERERERWCMGMCAKYVCVCVLKIKIHRRGTIPFYIPVLINSNLSATFAISASSYSFKLRLHARYYNGNACDNHTICTCCGFLGVTILNVAMTAKDPSKQERPETNKASLSIFVTNCQICISNVNNS
jgi:hypothetical protein